MAARTKKAKSAASAAVATTSPWVQRLLEDEELRDNFRVAFEAAKDAYERIADGGGPRAFVEDKKVKKDLGKAAEALREASTALREGPRARKRRRGPARALVLLVVGAIVALVVSEDLRGKVLDLLFGKEEEFEYTSTSSSSASSAS